MSLTIEQFVTTGFGWTKPSLSSQKNYRNHIRQFEFFLKSRQKTAQDGTVTDQDIWDYIEQLKSKYQPNTVATKVAAIKSYFKWLKNEGALTYKPVIRSQKHIKTTHKELNDSDVNTILKNLTGDALSKKRDLAMFSLIIYCGLKTSEVIAMNAENIDFANAEITVKGQKYPFHTAFTEVKAYADAKMKEGFHGKPLTIDAKDEPFFLNKYRCRITTRAARRRLMTSMSKTHNMRDLRHTYLLKGIASNNPVT